MVTYTTLDVVEDTLNQEMGLVDLRMVCIKSNINSVQERLQDLTSWSDDTDEKTIMQELKALDRELSEKLEEKAMLQLTHD